MLAAVSFDGLADTFCWLRLPRHQPARVPRPLGRRRPEHPRPRRHLGADRHRRSSPPSRWPAASPPPPPASRAGRPRILAFLPIAAGYHAAHYLTALLGNGQYLIAALDDPLANGASLLGLPHHWVSFAFLSDRASVTAIWNAQFALILGAHLLAVLIALRLATPAPRIAHLPMTALMVAYTVFGLWLLSAAPPPERASPAPAGNTPRTAAILRDPPREIRHARHPAIPLARSTRPPSPATGPPRRGRPHRAPPLDRCLRPAHADRGLRARRATAPAATA